MPAGNRFVLYKAILLVIVAIISIACRTAQQIVSLYRFNNDLVIVATTFEARLVDGLTIEDCPQFNSYNLILLPELNDTQRAQISSNCHKILSKNLSATFDETVYNISNIKGFGISSAKSLAKIIWKIDD